jgi:VWFA-related protein
MKIARRSLLLVLFAKAWAQDQASPDQPTFSAGVNVVSILATVRDKDGRFVKDLNTDDFVLLEDGVPQKIRYFSRESGLPLTIGLLVDTSRSQTGVLGQERRASGTFLERMLRPDQDRAFIAHFDERVEILQDLTSSRTELADALQRLAIPGEYATLIYSAVRESAERVMKKQMGRKAFILLTDGVAFHDNTSIGTAIEFAQRADTILYSIRFSDSIKVYRPLKAAVMGVAKQHGKEALARMAKETGGATFEVSKRQSIEDIYAQIEDALRNQYSIGYMPAPEKLGAGAPGGYHKIKLSAKNPKLVVTAREGYYAR